VSIIEQRQLLDRREISAIELTRSYLERIEEHSGLEAFLHVNNACEAAAAKAQARIDSGESLAFTGIPVGLKDNLCTFDMPTTCASKMLKGYIPPYDATVVAKLRSQDAVFLGKLNMDEFAMGATTTTSYYKKTRNPFDPNRVPGGSSGGSAAAVSAGLCSAALGSDTGGSIRQPASFCGITGMRPTYGMVSRYGCVAFASSLDQVGPLGLSAKDCAQLLAAVAGADGHDQTSQHSTGLFAERSSAGMADDFMNSRYEQFPEKAPEIHLGVVKELLGESVEPETRQAVLNAAEWYRNAGCQVSEISIPILEHAVPAYYLISSAEASANLSRFDGVRYGHRINKPSSYEDLVEKSRAEGFGWEVKRRILLGSYALCSGYYDDYYIKATRLANALRSEYSRLFETYDAILSPASPMAAFAFDAVPEDPAQLYLADICTVGAALAGLPSLSTPCGLTSDGLPIGLMMTGSRWSDSKILCLADAFERSFKRPAPKINAS
jgi:aspartyl-tRNA(Asn)/glutamyl-tRNA(Gln) amidotransferase subunit A